MLLWGPLEIFNFVSKFGSDVIELKSQLNVNQVLSTRNINQLVALVTCYEVELRVLPQKGTIKATKKEGQKIGQDLFYQVILATIAN